MCICPSYMYGAHLYFVAKDPKMVTFGPLKWSKIDHFWVPVWLPGPGHGVWPSLYRLQDIPWQVQTAKGS